MPLNGDANASQDKVEKLAGPLLEEYLHIKVTEEQNISRTEVDGNFYDFMPIAGS